MREIMCPKRRALLGVEASQNLLIAMREQFVYMHTALQTVQAQMECLQSHEGYSVDQVPPQRNTKAFAASRQLRCRRSSVNRLTI